MESAGEDHGLRTQAQVLGQHVASRQQPFIMPRDTAETETQTTHVRSMRYFFNQSANQRLKHETLAQG